MPPLPKLGTTGVQAQLKRSTLPPPTKGTTPGKITGPVAPPAPPAPDVPITYVQPTPHITLPKLSRPPTTRDLIIKRTFDGRTPEAARDTIVANCKTKLAQQNVGFVTQFAADRVRDMQAALNNVFTKGTPDRTFLEAQGKDATIGVLASMTDSARITYEVSKPNQKPLYYRKDWTGRFNQVERPSFVVMDAKVRLDPMGIDMRYPTWAHPGLTGPTMTVTYL